MNFQTNLNRKLVDDSAYIVIGQFYYDSVSKKHLLKPSRTIKEPASIKSIKDVSVSFANIDDDRITYIPKTDREDKNLSLMDWFWSMQYQHDIEGAYGPGDCRLSLEIEKDTSYLVFANQNWEVTSSLIYTENDNVSVFIEAVETLVSDIDEPFGISFSLVDVLKRGGQLQLLETISCTPRPKYKIVSSANTNTSSDYYLAQPILVFDESVDNERSGLSDEQKQVASKKGLELGQYTNAPNLKTCDIGQKYLSIGKAFYAYNFGYFGQMIAENDGLFALQNTIYEHHFKPNSVSYEDVLELIHNYNNTP